ncbi:MAG: sigma-70 family RNA polymerase sigma factor [Desulfobulbaceae bacterium]|jgi:RNA polymerase primary sigma factor|nr:sigma-70 family RNA polymerase sigma factor [Desulfobulbaceae bacterium]
MNSIMPAEDMEVFDGTGYDNIDDDDPGRSCFLEMINHELLTPEEETQYSRTIRENFQAIVNLVLRDVSGASEVAEAKARIHRWQIRNPEIRPRQSSLRAMVTAVCNASLLHPENEAVQALHRTVHVHLQSLDAARDIMVQANLRLVVRIATTFRDKGLPFDDLVQEGIIGLLRAVMRFDHRMGNRLSSYASWWIRQAIGIALAQKTRIIHVPYNVVLLARRCSLAMDELRRQLGREPTAEEVALHSRLSMDEIKRVAEIPAEPLSLDIPVSDDGEWNLRAPPPGQRENSV